MQNSLECYGTPCWRTPQWEKNARFVTPSLNNSCLRVRSSKISSLNILIDISLTLETILKCVCVWGGGDNIFFFKTFWPYVKVYFCNNNKGARSRLWRLCFFVKTHNCILQSSFPPLWSVDRVHVDTVHQKSKWRSYI